MTTLNRRTMMTAGVAGLAGLAGVSRAEAACCEEMAGKADHARHAAGAAAEWAAELERLAVAPKTAEDYRKLANLAGIGKIAAERRAENLARIAGIYRKDGLFERTKAQGLDAARALEHVAEHQRDVAEALDHLIETYDGLAEPFAG